ncbi:phage terminase small subunit [Sphingobium yanoikuyae]|uniref:Terminase n=1 Tax=Sphingobium yanoikuyae TaxID=13690 RepID=A0A291N6P9_SPHYA|nr:phage terminase small subunit [Sphingobium yanoikuyae]ATI81472.1 terminase [Sphingobium yanoikuyae]ATI82915.1 terminase [Sphingobium yanoikuyae]
MTPARAHRERMAALAAAADPKPVVSSQEGGQSLAAHVERTPAMIYREQAAASVIAAAPEGATSAEDRIAAQIVLRLTHDLRRLKEIKSIDLKVAAKREMIPEYRDWIAGLLLADTGVGTGLIADVAPTIMVWQIDTGDFAAALDIGDFLLRHKVSMPSRYNRDVATVLVEEIATAALKAQGAGASFPIAILDRVADLTGHLDIHDEVRAKLLKAIGVEQLGEAEDLPADDAFNALTAAVSTLNEAQRLHDRVGVKDKIKRGLKLMAAITAAREKAIAQQNDEQGGDQAA